MKRQDRKGMERRKEEREREQRKRCFGSHRLGMKDSETRRV